MSSIIDHLNATRAAIPEREVELVSAEHAAGRLLAEPVMARIDSPSFDNSQMDGFAVPHSLLQGGKSQIGGMIAAGAEPPTQPIENATPIMTGAKIPPGTAAIVPVEECNPPTFDTDTIELPANEEGRFIRRAGSDIQTGQLLLRQDTTVTPAGVATLVSQGIQRVIAYEKASILIVTGGAEVGTHIPDSNAPMLTALAQRYGIDVDGYVTTNDDPEQLKKDLVQAIKQHQPNAVVTSGGISQGAFEVVRQALDGWFGHVDMQPGGPQGLSKIQNTPVISLPGNPVSTLVSFRMFVAPVLGHTPKTITTTLTSTEAGLDNRTQLLRGTLNEEGATPIGGPGSHLIAQAAHADCLIAIPPGGAQQGERIKVYPL